MINLSETFIEYNNFFDIDIRPNDVQIVYLKTRAEIDQIRGKPTENRIRAFTKGNIIYILDKDSLESQSSHKYDEGNYNKCIKHELAHIYFRQKTGGINPRWLNEGTCIYLSGQLVEKIGRPKYFQNFLEFYSHGGSNIYGESGFVVELLVDKFGKDKFTTLLGNLKNTNSKEEFETLFSQIYGFAPSYENLNNIYNPQTK